MMYIDMHRLFRLAFQIHLTWILWTDSFNEERGWWDGGLSKQWKHPPGKSQQHDASIGLNLAVKLCRSALDIIPH
jgi:hypothetical protein